MRYRIYLEKVDTSFHIDINDVEEIEQNENAYFLYNAAEQILFTAPLDKVIGIEKI